LTKSLIEPPRIAFFTDTFREANGVATLSQQLTQFAKKRNLPFLAICAGRETSFRQDGSLEILELKRGAASFPVDKGLSYDPLFARHKRLVMDHLLAFKPDLLHITGPGDVGTLGVWVAHTMGLASVASWHTNLHEYLARRLEHTLRLVPQKLRVRIIQKLEAETLRGLVRFYKSARFTLAPNQTYVDLLRAKNGRPSYLMHHGVDLTQYSPAPERSDAGQPFCIGYVGRLTLEKNVRALAEIDRRLQAAGERNYRFLIVGDGGQQKWLQAHLREAEMPGILRGKDLAAAYNRMDVFVFPSLTDTFGLVILEAMASGVPVILPPETGVRVGVRDGVSGFLSEDFTASVQSLMHDSSERLAMGRAARQFANANSWDAVFEQLYETYTEGLETVMGNRAVVVSG
jgi:glycosyltransferase involved in cell wall biosynthesis